MRDYYVQLKGGSAPILIESDDELSGVVTGVAAMPDVKLLAFKHEGEIVGLFVATEVAGWWRKDVATVVKMVDFSNKTAVSLS